MVRPILPTFVEAHSNAVIEVLIDYAFRDIVADRFDAGIRLGEKLEQDMIALKVGPELSMAVVATPGYLSRFGPIEHPNDLTRHRCINYRMIGAGTIYAWEFERDGRAIDVGVSGPLTFNEPELMLTAALDGLGVGYLLDHEVARFIEDGQLTRLLAEWTPLFRASISTTRPGGRFARCWPLLSRPCAAAYRQTHLRKAAIRISTSQAVNGVFAAPSTCE